MKKFIVLGVLGASAIFGLGVAIGQAQGKPDAESKPSPEAEAAMKAWKAYSTPGPQQKQLVEHFTGYWDGVVSDWYSGEESKSTCIINTEAPHEYLGRFVFSGVSMPADDAYPAGMSGLSIKGFNNNTKKYEMYWVDNGGTAQCLMSGTYDEKTKTYTYSGDMPGPGGAKPAKILEKIVDKDNYILEIHMNPGGGEKCVFRATLKRGVEPEIVPDEMEDPDPTEDPNIVPDGGDDDGKDSKEGHKHK